MKSMEKIEIKKKRPKMTLLGETSVPNFDNGTVARTVASDTRRPLIESCMYGPFSHLYIGE